MNIKSCLTVEAYTPEAEWPLQNWQTVFGATMVLAVWTAIMNLIQLQLLKTYFNVKVL